MEAPAFDRSTLSRALYSSDASLYRVVPQAVHVPRHIDALHESVDVALAEGLPITMRGAGTSCAGNAVGPGLVIDTRRLDRIHQLDLESGVAVVDPGVVQSVLSNAAGRHGWCFGPDPSTASRCTIGGMIGNNACGPRALGYGRTSDTITGLELVTGTGERLVLAQGADLRDHPSATLGTLRELVLANLGVIRTEFGRFGRQVSGYALEHLLPENGFDVARFLVGSEGTLGVVTQATVRLTREPAHRSLVVLGFGSLAEAADLVPQVLTFAPSACEGLDARIMDTVRARKGPDAVPPLPAGAGWLFVELADDDPGALSGRAVALAGLRTGTVIFTDSAIMATLWRLRSDGAGYAGIALAEPAHPGWEDAAVPTERLGAYLRDFEALLASHGLHGLPYGHFGEGCVHCRIDFPLGRSGGTAPYRRFVEDAADLAASYGGSMSGEHGDGRARSELLGRMYSPAALSLFSAVKQLFDPANLLNPGVLVDPAPLDADVRLAQVGHPLDAFALGVHRCSGVGRCVAAGADDAMCPSYQVTREEKDSTRGRARVLQELVNGTLITSPRSAEVAAALDLCLACKACASECPTGVDIARDKSRVLHQAYRRRVRPLTHYTLGWLPRWTRLVTGVPGLARIANGLLGTPALRGIALRAAGIDRLRGVPRFREDPLLRTVGGGRVQHGRPAAAPADDVDGGIRRPAPLGDTAAPTHRRGPVAVWPDSFSHGFAGNQVQATVRVLAAAGYEPQVIEQPACCGLTWISTGQLDTAAERLRRSLDVFVPLAGRGIPIVGVEPSCLAVWRDEAPDLVDDPRVARVAAALVTLAELLGTADGWTPPDLTGRTVIAQPHCHHRAVLGWQADVELLRRTGAQVRTVTGCCGLAGNFGMERGHYETSVAVAGLHLLPALDVAADDAIVLADGFSCRTQIADLTDRRAISLAELLDEWPG